MVPPDPRRVRGRLPALPMVGQRWSGLAEVPVPPTEDSQSAVPARLHRSSPTESDPSNAERKVMPTTERPRPKRPRGPPSGRSTTTPPRRRSSPSPSLLIHAEAPPRARRRPREGQGVDTQATPPAAALVGASGRLAHATDLPFDAAHLENNEVPDQTACLAGTWASTSQAVRPYDLAGCSVRGPGEAVSRFPAG